MLGVEATPKTIVAAGGKVTTAIVFDGFVDIDGKIGVVGAAPAVGDAVAGDELAGLLAGVVEHVALCPKDFAVVVVDGVVEVEDEPWDRCSGVHHSVGWK